MKIQKIQIPKVQKGFHFGYIGQNGVVLEMDMIAKKVNEIIDIMERDNRKGGVKIGDVFYSDYFESWCQIVEFLEDGYFLFKRNKKDKPIRSRIKCSYLLDNNLIFRNDYLW